MTDQVQAHPVGPSVFISYAWDSDENVKWILRLSERLRADGIVSEIDQYVSGTPDEGWPRWMRNKISSATFVLIVCTETYYRRFIGQEVPEKGKGADWEGLLITQELYDTRSATSRFVPVLPPESRFEHIPEALRKHTHYPIQSEAGYQKLLDFLLSRAGVEPAPVQPPRQGVRIRGEPLRFDMPTPIAKPGAAASGDPGSKRQSPAVQALEDLMSNIKTSSQQPGDELPVVMLITFNKHESVAVHNCFGCSGVETRNGTTFNFLGIHQGVRVVHCVSKQGEGEAQSAAHAAIEAWRPHLKAIIGVGIAFGVNEQKQKIGDVLVSETIRGYELGRVNSDGTLTLRSDKPAASHTLYNRLNTLEHLNMRSWPTCRFGTLLSGSRLVDNVDYRNSLLQHEREAIGGEMEAVGIQKAAERYKIDWIIVKAICDWANGNKSADETANQKKAAKNAAKVVHAAITLSPLYGASGTSNTSHTTPSTSKTPVVAESASSRAQADYENKIKVLIATELQKDALKPLRLSFAANYGDGNDKLVDQIKCWWAKGDAADRLLIIYKMTEAILEKSGGPHNGLCQDMRRVVTLCALAGVSIDWAKQHAGIDNTFSDLPAFHAISVDLITASLDDKFHLTLQAYPGKSELESKKSIDISRLFENGWGPCMQSLVELLWKEIFPADAKPNTSLDESNLKACCTQLAEQILHEHKSPRVLRFKHDDGHPMTAEENQKAFQTHFSQVQVFRVVGGDSSGNGAPYVVYEPTLVARIRMFLQLLDSYDTP